MQQLHPGLLFLRLLDPFHLLTLTRLPSLNLPLRRPRQRLQLGFRRSFHSLHLQLRLLDRLLPEMLLVLVLLQFDALLALIVYLNGFSLQTGFIAPLF